MSRSAEAQSRSIRRRNHWFLPTIITALVLTAAWIFAEWQYHQITHQSARSQVTNKTALLRANLEGLLTANTHIVHGLVATLSTEPDMTQLRFSQLSEIIMGDAPQVIATAAAPDLVVTLIQPYDPDSPVLGLDYNKNEAQRDAAYRVRDLGQMVLAGPVNLVQGGTALIARFPVFVGAAGNSEGKFWGIVSAVIDIERLYTASGLLDPDLGLDLALVGADATGETGKQFFGSPEVLSSDPVLMDITLPSGSWQIAARPTGGWEAVPSPNSAILRLIMFLASALILWPTYVAGRRAQQRAAAIAKLERRELQLLVQSRRLDIALESSKIGIWEFNTVTDEVFWDRQMNLLYGFEADKSDHDSKTWETRVHPEDLDRVETECARIVENQSTSLSNFRIQLPDGSTKSLRSIAKTYTNDDGQLILIGVDWDVTEDVILQERLQSSNTELVSRQAELEQAHAHLKEQQRDSYQLALIAKHASDSIMIADAGAKLLWVNDAFTKMTGYSRSEAIGKRPGDLLNGPGTDPEVVEGINAHIGRGEALHTEILNYTKSGDEICVEITMLPIAGENGEPDLVISIERDITAAKNHQQELAAAKTAAETADRVKSEFLATMSHEIRTPMNGIIGMADLLHNAGLPPEQALYLETIRTSSTALLDIINDILDLSRLDEGKLSVSPVAFDLRSCLRSSVELLRPLAIEKNLYLTLDTTYDTPTHGLADDGRLRQILVNLVGNALKFTETGGVSVRVSARPTATGHQLDIEVRDSGIGISPENIGHIFDRFSQEDAAITRRFGGTGLGLTISNMLARLMGGEISVTSVQGEGTCFHLSLPLAPATAKSTLAKQNSTAPDPDELSGKVVLVAEDNKTNRLLISKFLEHLPVELYFAENGREAVVQARATAPDIILMDMSMPVMNGLEATREIRAMAGIHPVIIALTANAYESDREACFEAGMDYFLSKPLRKNQLLEALHDAKSVSLA
ncbi:ATP-binding protein [Candidatus Halocynthiibacter alkanivorans]|uniref:ATP-binding protein n=1 Tax=Candidatus Halocynthiibacter alkanivorans TaxID=2267619 RepID=UPI000DF3D4A0|nr:ATP-binding protein [Candidatus Halocynthiibacter alkanivorans]